jgi:hypothetical protein
MSRDKGYNKNEMLKLFERHFAVTGKEFSLSRGWRSFAGWCLSVMGCTGFRERL